MLAARTASCHSQGTAAEEVTVSRPSLLRGWGQQGTSFRGVPGGIRNTHQTLSQTRVQFLVTPWRASLSGGSSCLWRSAVQELSRLGHSCQSPLLRQSLWGTGLSCRLSNGVEHVRHQMLFEMEKRPRSAMAPPFLPSVCHQSLLPATARQQVQCALASPAAWQGQNTGELWVGVANRSETKVGEKPERAAERRGWQRRPGLHTHQRFCRLLCCWAAGGPAGIWVQPATSARVQPALLGVLGFLLGDDQNVGC